MFSREIIEHAKALGVTPDVFATQVDIAMAMGQSRVEAIATAYLHFADPGLEAYEAIYCEPEQPEDEAVCERDVYIPTPWELTEPEDMYAESVRNHRLQESVRRLRNSAENEQLSQRGPFHDGKEGA